MAGVGLFDTSTLKVGDMWPSRRFHRFGPIVSIREYDGIRTDVTGIAVFTDGTEVTIGGVTIIEGDD